MFCLFKNNELVNFWGNAKGDIFLKNTCRNFGMDEMEADLLWYSELKIVPGYSELFSFDPDKNLQLKKKVITMVDSQLMGPEGVEVTIQNEVISYEIERTIIPVVYFSKGISFLPC
jgi:hypothetical protein